MSEQESKIRGEFQSQYQNYSVQKCFIAYTEQADWSEDLLCACKKVLCCPEFNLEPDYARQHFEPDEPLRHKALELIANSRYGIYDLSYIKEKSGKWRMPCNVFIELGMAIALNRPTLLLRHTSNRGVELPKCLGSVSGYILEFTGTTSLEHALETKLPQWINVPPKRDWWNRYCIFGNRRCEYREAHPQARQWGKRELYCHISDGVDVDFCGVVEDVLERFNDVTFGYLDALPLNAGYTFLLCRYCQTVRISPFAIYRICPDTPAGTFMAIGMNIALEYQFEYKIPKILMTEDKHNIPSLLEGYEVFVACSDNDRKKLLREFLPKVIQKVRAATWKPRKLPFTETRLLLEEINPPEEVVSESIYVLIVDDNIEDRQRLANLLQPLGCETREAATNEQALEFLSRNDLSFSLVTTDAQRESAEGERFLGLELIKTLNQRFPELPVLLFSFGSPEWLKEQAPELCVSAVLDKELSDKEISIVLQKVLDGEIAPSSLLEQEHTARIQIWEDLAKAYEEGRIIEGKVIKRIKGGLSVDIGIKAFLPGSQVDLRPIRNLKNLIGETIRIKIIELNRRRENIVVSRRVILEEERESVRQETLESLEEGKIVNGIVKNITDYGVFVDLGGIDGLLHVTNISWEGVNHLSELFQFGDEIEVVVLSYNKEEEKVSLGLKQKTPDPWESVEEKYPVGSRVSGKVVSITDYGAFVELETDVEGLIHISEMSWTKRVKHPSKAVELDEIVEALVLDLDKENRRISLGLKQIEPNPWAVVAEKYPPGSIVTGIVRNLTDFGAFIELEEGVDGLVHISDMSWTTRIKHPSEVLKKGEQVQAVLLSIDVENERLSLGIKQLHPNPWEGIADSVTVGDNVTGRVVRLTDFGAFIEIANGVEGLLHVSEISRQHVKKPEDVLSVDSEIIAKVIKLDEENRRIGLSIKAYEEELLED